MHKSIAASTAGLLLIFFMFIASNNVFAEDDSTIATKKPSPNTSVVMETSLGNITLELFDKQSPATVTNFLKYVDKGHYTDTIFHRVIPRFMIQGGGFNIDMQEQPTNAPVENESRNRLHNERGTIAMARTSDPHSATAQFFINVRMNTNLDFRRGQFGYTVFGKVVDGMDVVDEITRQTTTQVQGYSDVPVEPILIKSIHR